MAKADIFAGEGSTASKVKKQRQSIERGDTSMNRPVVGGQAGLDATGEPIDENSPSNVINRGYFIAKDDT